MDFGNLPLNDYKELTNKLGNDIVDYSLKKTEKYFPGEENSSHGVTVLIISTLEALCTYISAYKRLTGMSEENIKIYEETLFRLFKVILKSVDKIELDDN